MTIQINYKKSTSVKASSNLILFVDEKFNIGGLKKYISTNEFSYISDLLKNSNLKKDFFFFDVNSKKTIFLVRVKKDVKVSDIENLGAKFYDEFKDIKQSQYFLNSDTAKLNEIDINQAQHSFAGIGRAMIQNQNQGLVKVYAKKEGPIVGASICGPSAGEMIHELMYMVGWEALPEDAAEFIHAHPTLSEAVGESLLSLNGKGLD